MILKALKYGSSNWSIASGATHDDFVAFENINLIVGRNASGKTRFIDVVRWISDILDSKLNAELSVYNSPESLSFELVFKSNEDLIQYILVTDTESEDFGINWIDILDEKLFINGQNKLDRKLGQLYYEQLKDTLDFEVDKHYLAIDRRDDKQQPFFKLLHDWGRDLSHYSFGGNMGKRKNNYSEPPELSDTVNFKNSHKVKQIYSRGNNEFGEMFKHTIIDDMKCIDYFLNDINATDNVKTSLRVLLVEEADLKEATYFENMSQGMARAFSLLVQLNYSLMAKIPSCILIDDIGEGLDYERSRSLIELIIKKVEGSNIQLFMTTNDRFVMNSVPLKYWSVIHREGNKSVFYNYQNSKQTFDDFALTGFNNFDFFATEFYRLGFEEFIETNK